MTYLDRLREHRCARCDRPLPPDERGDLCPACQPGGRT